MPSHRSSNHPESPALDRVRALDPWAVGRAVGIRWMALLTAAAMLGGCLYVKQPGALFGGLLTMRVSTVPKLNQDMPVAVEVLVVYDAKILDQVSQLSAEEWFTGRAQFLRDNPPATDAFQTWRWEWVPAQAVPDQEMRYALGARSTVVFVSYQTPGEHRALVAPRQDFLLSLQLSDFETRLLE